MYLYFNHGDRDHAASNSHAPLYCEPWRIRMNQRLSALVSILVGTAAAVWTSLVNSSHALTVIEAKAYRPEKYYMRGPGPKWRAKHAQISVGR